MLPTIPITARFTAAPLSHSTPSTNLLGLLGASVTEQMMQIIGLPKGSLIWYGEPHPPSELSLDGL